RFELRGPYPTRITAIVNAVAQRYVQVYADLKRQKVIELTKILGEQVQHSQENLRNAEAALQRFREETITLPSDRPAAGASVAGAGVGGAGAAGGARDPVFGGFFETQLTREEARRDQAELGRRVDADSRSLRQIPARTIEEARLRRDASLAENLYTSLQQKYDEARLAEASTLADVRVLDSAVVPRRPVKNTAPRVILMAFFGS